MVRFPSPNRDKFKLDDYVDELWSTEDWVLGIFRVHAEYNRKLWPARMAQILGIHRQKVARVFEVLVKGDLIRELDPTPPDLRQCYGITAKGSIRDKLRSQELLRALGEAGYADGSLGNALLSYGMYTSVVGILRLSFERVERVQYGIEDDH